jgi:hypothetical protein
LISSCCLGKTMGSSIYDATNFSWLFDPLRRPGRKGWDMVLKLSILIKGAANAN